MIGPKVKVLLNICNILFILLLSFRSSFELILFQPSNLNIYVTPLQVEQVGPNYVQNDENKQSIECDCQQEEPTDSVSDFLNDKALFHLFDQGTVVFLCVCGVCGGSAKSLRPSTVVIRNQPQFHKAINDAHTCSSQHKPLSIYSYHG